jgi:ribonuclease HI
MNENQIEKTIIYTDGASSGNPGPGGWGAVMRHGNNVIELGGSEEKTTNNRMEMSAAIGSLEKTPEGSNINLYTDSQYLINGITKWVFGWLKNDWKTKEGKEVLNKDLWQRLHDLVKDRKVNWIAVRGHAGVALNNRVDEIAVAFSTVAGEGADLPDLFSGTKDDYFFVVAEPTKEELEASSSNDRKRKKAYSYLSMVDGVIEKHSTWDQCKARVDGVAGAKFRKSIDATDEAEIVRSWGGE